MTNSDLSQKKAIAALKLASTLSVLLVLIHFYKWSSGSSLSWLGVFPREVDGLLGIVTAPFIHGDWEHLFSNLLPLFMLSFVISFFYKRVAIMSMLLIYLLTGFLVWFLARPVYHIGASGVVYGLVSFVFWTGVFRRNVKSIVLALAVLVMYSGYFLGIVPFKEGVSWESHLLGAIVGIIVAFLFKSYIEKDEEQKQDPWKDEKLEPEAYLLPRDVFEKTHQERYQEYLDQQNK